MKTDPTGGGQPSRQARLYHHLSRKGSWQSRVAQVCARAIGMLRGSARARQDNPAGKVLSRWRKISQKPATSRLQPSAEKAQQLSVNGSTAFSQFWQDVPQAQRYTDTVDHRLMTVAREQQRLTGMEGHWHVKGPGRESRATKMKRAFQRLVYFLSGRLYKGRYYDDPQLLIQKEVVATQLYRCIKSARDPEFAQVYQCGYSYDQEHKRHYGAFKHLEGCQEMARLAPEDRPAFSPEHNPAVDLVIRRFLLGDEDYLKLDNYMYKPTGEGAQVLYAIDFGMAFYNRFKLPERCDFATFKKRLLTPSGKHRVQYHNRKTLLDFVGSNCDRDLKAGLEMVASLSDDAIKAQCAGIARDGIRMQLETIIKYKRDQARFITGRDNNWPDKRVSSAVMNRLV